MYVGDDEEDGNVKTRMQSSISEVQFKQPSQQQA